MLDKWAFGMSKIDSASAGSNSVGVSMGEGSGPRSGVAPGLGDKLGQGVPGVGKRPNSQDVVAAAEVMGNVSLDKKDESSSSADGKDEKRAITRSGGMGSGPPGPGPSLLSQQAPGRGGGAGALPPVPIPHSNSVDTPTATASGSMSMDGVTETGAGEQMYGEGYGYGFTQDDPGAGPLEGCEKITVKIADLGNGELRPSPRGKPGVV